MQLLVGLGNPGPRFSNTPHNIGFRALDALGQTLKLSKWCTHFGGLCANARHRDEKILAFKPQTYVNRSGPAVRALVRFYKIPLSKVVVFHDELELPKGKIRLKRGGGNAGHKGLASLDAGLGVDYLRVRIGIGRPTQKTDVKNYVLRSFETSDTSWMRSLLTALAQEIPLLLQGKYDSYASRIAMHMQKVSPPPTKHSPRTDVTVRM